MFRFRSLIQHDDPTTTFRSTHTTTLNPTHDVPTKKGHAPALLFSLIFWPTANTGSTSSCVWIISLSISRTLASVCLFVFWSPYYFTSSAAQEHNARLDKAGSKTPKMQGVQNTPPCSSPCLVYFDFSLSFSLSPSSYLWDLEGVELVSVLFPYISSSCARYSGWVPKTCNYAQFHPSDLRRIARFSPDHHLC